MAALTIGSRMLPKVLPKCLPVQSGKQVSLPKLLCLGSGLGSGFLGIGLVSGLGRGSGRGLGSFWATALTQTGSFYVNHFHTKMQYYEIYVFTLTLWASDA